MRGRGRSLFCLVWFGLVGEGSGGGGCGVGIE